MELPRVPCYVLSTHGACFHKSGADQMSFCYNTVSELRSFLPLRRCHGGVAGHD